MSTRFVGEFPKNMAEIVDVFKRANKRLDILVDLAAYGHYSWPEEFERYAKIIHDKCEKGVQVRMVVYSRERYDELFCRQFPKDRFDEEMRSERFKFFFHKYSGLSRPTTWDAFRETITNEQRVHCQNMLKNGVVLRSVSSDVLMSLWLGDQTDAVFSFQNATEREREVSFRTRDSDLIRSLQKTFEMTWEGGKDLARAIAV